MAYIEQFFIADTHFQHQLMLRDRPFVGTDEMDRYLIDRWNETVKDTDIVWHLGDFSFGDPGRATQIFKQLKGRKRLVIGNHDVDSKGRLHKHLAALDWDQPPEQMCQANVDGHRVWLCHYSMQSWPAKHYGAYHLFGHSHGQLPGIGLSRDVGVDCPDVAFTPRTLKQLMAGMPKQEIAA